MDSNNLNPEFRPELYPGDVTEVARRAVARYRSHLTQVNEDELVQEIWVYATEHLAQFSGSTHEHFVAWLYRIAQKRVVNMVRRAKRNDKLHEDEQSSDTRISALLSTGDLAQESAALEEAVRAAMEQLPEAERDLLHQYYLDGTTLADSAKALGISNSSAQSRLYRARQRLRTIVDREKAKRLPVTVVSKVAPVEAQEAEPDVSFDLWIDPGHATIDDLRELFQAFSDLNRAAGGAGLTFVRGKDNAYVPQGVN